VLVEHMDEVLFHALLPPESAADAAADKEKMPIEMIADRAGDTKQPPTSIN